MEKINNITSLRDDLVKAYQQLRNGQITDSHAKEVANMAGKIINSVKTELAYDDYHDVKEGIKFMDKPLTPPKPTQNETI